MLQFFIYPFILLQLTILSCSTEPVHEREDDTPALPEIVGDSVSVLMIGNSNMGYNDLPGTFRELCEVRQRPVIVGKMIWYGRCLDYQAINIMTQNKIKERAWDYVVLLGCATRIAYPSEASWSGVKWAVDTLKQVIEKNYPASQTVYFLPWAYADGVTWTTGEVHSREEMQENILANSLSLSRDLDVILAPVGIAFKNTLSSGYMWQTLILGDRVHPQPQGTFLAVCTIYTTLFGESTELIPFTQGLNENTAFELRQIGSLTVLDSLELWNTQISN
ncbi:MAG: hypothetical protein K9N35_03060 [Candidatus Marinimicrobia bacterium]|nr:hypothetical protein [Candidatus Neomarinimicrobiota bacterium]